jgi:hypothetical protein
MLKMRETQDPVMSANESVEELVLGSGSTSFIPMRQRQRKEGAASKMQ